MANFPPLKHYLIYCLEKIIRTQSLTGPFLDVGCGSGDIAECLAAQGWQGRAIDISEAAARDAQKRLGPCGVDIACASIFTEDGKYATVAAMDILEHIEDDAAFLKKIATLLSGNGKLILAVPSHPREWRWDDVFYGHARRYSPADFKDLLARTGFRTILCWDFTFPVFWFLRRLYTLFMRPPHETEESPVERTRQSSLQNAWRVSGPVGLLFKSKLLWRPVFWLQYNVFRHCTGLGHEILLVAEKGTTRDGQ